MHTKSSRWLKGKGLIFTIFFKWRKQNWVTLEIWVLKLKWWSKVTPKFFADDLKWLAWGLMYWLMSLVGWALEPQFGPGVKYIKKPWGRCRWGHWLIHWFIWILNYLFDKYDENHLRAVPERTTQFCSLLIRVACSTVSKAVEQDIYLNVL